MSDFQTALALASRGFKVFPLTPGAKSPPLWDGWPQRATAAVPTDWPTGANVGIHCAGLVVIDVDPRKGGSEAMAALDIETPGLPATLTSRTPSGGSHLFYRLPEGHPGVPNRVNALGDGIDIRSTGGYVVGAGSTTPQGAYTWLYDVPVADAPLWLLEALGKPRERSPDAGTRVPDADEPTVERARTWLEARPGAVEGQGGDAFTFGTAAFLRDFGVSAKQAFDLMSEWNARCSPPWGLDDLWAKVENAYRYAGGQAGAKAVTADDFPDVQPNADLSKGVVPNLVGINPVSAQYNRRTPVAMRDIARGPATAASYIIKGLLMRRSYAMLYGPPGEGKTFVGLDMAYHVAMGLEWMGRRVRQGDALYVGFEAYGGLANRVLALRGKYGADAPLYIVGGGFDLRQLEGRQAFGQILAALPNKPALIVYDTFAYALAGGDENSAQDVGSFNTAVQGLIENTGACVLLIHHTGKDTNRGARGSSALPAAIDTEIAILDRTLTSTKQRETELGAPIGFQLTPVMIGTDEDGDGIMSCVVDPATPTPDRPRAKKGNEERVLDELIRLSPNNEPIGYINLLEACVYFLPDTDGRRRAAFRDAIVALENKGLIARTKEGMISRVMT